MLRLGSLFSGSGGFELAGSLCGIEPVWAAEVEPYPIAVTTSRFPNMKHLGSVTDINGAEVEPVDIVTFGSPCQDLSVAGKRAGLKHEGNGDEETTRSGLFMEAIRIIKEMRSKTNGAYPTFAVWENVPGAFSSNKGEDFRIVLEELIKIVEPTAVMPEVPKGGWAYADYYCGDGWSLGYRVFDAQYWGVPQRRRRIYLVADFRGQRAKEILFEREGLRGYFAKSRTPWQGIAADAENGIGADDREGDRNCLTPWDVQSRRIFTADGSWPALYGGEGGGHGYVCYPDDDREKSRIINLNKGDVQSKAILDPSGIAPSLYAGECRYGGGECYVLDKVGADDREGDGVIAFAQNQREEVRDLNNVAVALNAEPGTHQQTFVAVPYSERIKEVLPFDTTQVTSPQNGNNPKWGDPCHPLAAQGHPPTAIMRVADDREGHCCYGISSKQQSLATTKNIANTLGANDYKEPQAVVYAIDQQGGKGGANYAEEVMPTLCSDSHGTPHAVAYGISSYDSNAMKSSNPHSGIYKADTSRTLDLNGGNPTCNQGGIAIVEQHLFENHSQDTRYKGPLDVCPMLPAQLGTGGNNTPFVVGEVRSYDIGEARLRTPSEYTEVSPTLTARCGTGGNNTPAVVYPLEGNGARPSHLGDGYSESDKMYTLNTIERHAVAYGEPIAIDRAAFNQGQNAQYEPQFYEDGTVSTLVAKGPSAVAYKNVRYIVRRLTPTECARLQGFPDRWGDIDYKTDFTDAEYAFWLNVRNTHAAINGKATKSYTREQMLAWYNKLHTDSAEYKMWGNGVALPCALYVLSGIAKSV